METPQLFTRFHAFSDAYAEYRHQAYRAASQAEDMRAERKTDMNTRPYWLAASLLGVLAAPVAAPPVAAKSFLSQQPVHSGPARANECLGAAGGPTEPDIVVFPCTGHPDQLWTMNNDGTLVNQNRQCIGVEGAKVARGTKLVGFRCDGTPNQRWLFNPGRLAGEGIFVNGADHSLCMTRIITSDKLNHVVLSDCTGEPPQQWSTGYGS